MRIAEKSRFIIERWKQYLVYVTNPDLPPELWRWSPSRYDAAMIEDQRDAEYIAQRAGGAVIRFNPITGTAEG